METKKAILKWSISRARDTYGYNVVTLIDCDTGKKYRACGGGYDMTGTVFADWIEDVYQNELRSISDLAQSMAFYDGKDFIGREHLHGGLYGMTTIRNTQAPDKVSLDGACGLDCIIGTCNAIGLSIQKTYDRSKRNPSLYAFYVSKI